MTTPGATEAVTPEQLIRKFDEGWEVFLSSQLGDLSKQIALAELAEAIRQYGREAESNALRRAVDAVRSFGYGGKDFDIPEDNVEAVWWTCNNIEETIRSLLPKEAGK